MTDIPTMVFFYNRPRNMKKMLQALKISKPRTLYLVSDGPKDFKDAPLVEECRAIVDKIEWDCRVTRIYSEQNMGMALRSFSATDKVIGDHEGLLMLEDDCIPRPEFFEYLETAIAQVRLNGRVAAIGGYNPIGRTPLNSDHYYTASSSFRGWGVYLKAKHWEDYKKSGIIEAMTIKDCLAEASKYPGMLLKVIKFKIIYAERRKVGHGDISLGSFFHRNNLLALVPRESLIDYVGEGPDATHTQNVPNLALPTKRDINYSNPPDLGILEVNRVDVLEGWFIAVWFIRHLLFSGFGSRGKNTSYLPRAHKEF